MRFQSASSWSFSYEVCRRPRANAPRVPRRRSDFPPASCGASARASARREAHRRVASPPAPIAISERSPAVPEMSVPRVSAAAAAFGDSQPVDTRTTVCRVGFAQAGPFDGERGIRAWDSAPIASSRRVVNSAGEFHVQGNNAGRVFAANQRSRRGAGRATGSRCGAFPRRGKHHGRGPAGRGPPRGRVARAPRGRVGTSGGRPRERRRRGCLFPRNPRVAGGRPRGRARARPPAHRREGGRGVQAGASRHALARRAHAPGVGVPRPGAAAPATHTRVGRAGDRSAPFGGRGG